ncbi:hypothetical protein [Paraglaciecola sp. L3A3]|uniref:hypothetical protein n=1 Tax=Paraglaciecola sp. L3A3 TaxID=2686358 RepID=UPI00131AF3A8|nr:hypothetical protein [Paraglaciecola sp. L3A3]
MMKQGNKKVENPDDIWQQFVAKGYVEKLLRAEDFIDKQTVLPAYSDAFPKQAMKTIKGALTDDAYLKLNGRWRKFKYDKSNNNTTITIHKDTLLKLKKFAEKSGFKDDAYDFALEFLLDPEEKLEPYISNDELLNMESFMNVEQSMTLLKAKLRLRQHTWKQVLNIIEYSFRCGWLACKSLRANKRTQTALDEASENFVDEAKGLKI